MISGQNLFYHQKSTTGRANEGRTASRTMAPTTARMSMRHAARRPAFRWYSAAVVSSSAAAPVSTATEEMLSSMLSRDRREYGLLNAVRWIIYRSWSLVGSPKYQGPGISPPAHGYPFQSLGSQLPAPGLAIPDRPIRAAKADSVVAELVFVPVALVRVRRDYGPRPQPPTLRLGQPCVVSRRSLAVRVGKQPTTSADHAKSSEAPSFGAAIMQPNQNLAEQV